MGLSWVVDGGDYCKDLPRLVCLLVLCWVLFQRRGGEGGEGDGDGVVAAVVVVGDDEA